MIEIEVTPKNWGHSLAMIFPRDIVKKLDIKPNKKQRILIPEREVDLMKIFGTFKFKKSAQRLKDENRAGW